MGAENSPEQFPIDAFLGGFGPADKDDRPDFAVRGRDGKTDFGSEENGEGRTNLDRESRRGRHFGQVLSDGLNHSPAPYPEADRDAQLENGEPSLKKIFAS